MSNPQEQSLPSAPIRYPSAVLWLAVAGMACLTVYAIIFTRTASLHTFIDTPKYDLRLMVDAQPSLLWLYRAGFIILLGGYILGGWATSQKHNWTAWGIVLLTAFLSAGTLVFLYPFDASDIFDYVMHGRMLTFYNANPYQVAPAAYPLDPIYPYVGWVKSTSPYGPFWLQLSAMTARIAGNSIVGNVIAFKLLGGIFYFISVGLVAVILNYQNPARTLTGVWLFACNPLVLYETFGHGHNDITLTACLLASVWFMLGRQYTFAALALVTGALFKHITLLVLPAVILFALHNLDNWKTRVRYLVLTGLSGILLLVFAYQPLWVGWKTIDLSPRMYLYTTSLTSIINTQLSGQFDPTILSKTISIAAAVLTLTIAFFLSWHFIRGKNWMNYPKAALSILLFYLLVTCLWFQQWYIVWLVGLVVLLPFNSLSFTGYFLSFWVMTKVLVFAPPLLWVRPLPHFKIREFWLSMGVMGIPWLVCIILLIRHGIRSVQVRIQKTDL